ncbi:NifB/NifX family molybdenum-iron cluster-binding protein [Maribellus mangrovi]|uniref:NifB/NifX family molybdenum-iron cluster-binding protein n=1 Tax=Maribellus mangrovi TaxID=3133146 RepID=UPI0030ECB4F0
MNKLFAITSSGKTEKSFLDLRFGKCANIVLFDPVKNVFSIQENTFVEQEHSGIKLVEFLQKQGVTTIITGEVGPMVSKKLEKEKLQLVLLHEERIKIEEIMDRISEQ